MLVQFFKIFGFIKSAIYHNAFLLDPIQSQMHEVHVITEEVNIDFPPLDINDLCNDQICIEDQQEYSNLLTYGTTSMLVAMYRKSYYDFLESNTYRHYVVLLDQYMLSRERFIMSQALAVSDDKQEECLRKVAEDYCALLEYSEKFKTDRDAALNTAYSNMKAYVEKSI